MDSINSNELFLGDNFTIESLLAGAQEHKLKGKELRDRLLRRQQDLNQESLELFNKNYDRFYKLSYIISCLADPTQRLVDPLQSFRDLLNDSCRNHEAYVEQINTILGSLEDVSRSKQIAGHLLLPIRRLDRIEKQMDDIDWSVKPTRSGGSYSTTIIVQSGGDKLKQQQDCISHKIKCDLLERISIELYDLSCEIRAIKPTNNELVVIKSSLETGLNSRQNQLDSWFETTFLEAIESEDKHILDLIVRTFQQRDASYKLDAVWCNKVVRSYLNLTITDEQLAQQLDQVYELLDQFLKRQLDLIQAEFVVRSFWSEVVASLDKLDRFYSLQDLDTFQKRYIATKAFLGKQNDYLFDDEAENSSQKFGLSKEESTANSFLIMSKFNLKGYLSYRMSQIASSVELSFSQQPLSETIPSVETTTDKLALSQFKLKICQHIYVMVTQCWSPKFHIDTLESSFSQSACRVINRFSDWLSKLRLSDFRITGPAAPENNRQTNFLAKQDAIMRLLIEDCARLAVAIKKFFSELPSVCDRKFVELREELISLSLDELNNGLSNVRSLQRLIER